MSDEEFVTHTQLDSKLQIYDSEIKNHIMVSQSSLKSDFIQYVNEIVQCNRDDFSILTNTMDKNNKAVEAKIDAVRNELGSFKTILIITLLTFIVTTVIGSKFF